MTPVGRLRFLHPDGSVTETDAYRQLNLLAHADMAEIDIPQKCGGQAECGTCRVRLVDGPVTEIRGDERHLMQRHQRRFSPGHRLSCRCRPLGDVTVELLATLPRDLRDDDAGS